MPSYTFKCKTCEHIWDEWLSPAGRPDKCPECGAEKELHKQFSFTTKNSEESFRPYKPGERLNEFIKESKESLNDLKQSKMSND